MAKLKWFPPHRHGTRAMQRLGAGTENILKDLLGFVCFLNLTAYAAGKLLKGFFPAIAWPFKVAGKMLGRRMHEGHTLTYIDFLYF